MTRDRLLELMRRCDGILKLRPEYVHRFYPDLNRLNQARLKRSPRQFIPERWIGSSVRAVNPPPIPSGGISMLANAPEPMALRDAIRGLPLEMLGERVVAAHGAEFRVLVKVLDPGEPIVFHLHATDAQLRRMPRHFPGHRFGKDEAYYFLDGIPKGSMPYTHVGLYDGVTRRELIEAVRRGPEHALELSPSIYQEYETGFFVPAGVPHRPGTALTLEIQQPSDVYTLLETHAGGKAMSPRQIHPGFRSLDDAFALIDLPVSRQVGRLSANRLAPRVDRRTAGGEIATIFPREICGKFAGRRLRVAGTLTYREPSPMVLWVWRGRGKLNGRAIRAGDEFFVAHSAAAGGVELRSTGSSPLELFSFLPA
jgi:mannose-6-phosphate isomerase class I